jgi:hypothetical protein
LGNQNAVLDIKARRTREKPKIIFLQYGTIQGTIKKNYFKSRKKSGKLLEIFLGQN